MKDIYKLILIIFLFQSCKTTEQVEFDVEIYYEEPLIIITSNNSIIYYTDANEYPELRDSLIKQNELIKFTK